MAGVILENMSTKKILIFCGILLVLQIICFLVGGLLAPLPTNPVRILGTKCIDDTVNHLKFFPPRGKSGCERVKDFDEATRKHISAEEIVFSFQIPHPKQKMSRLFQFMVGVLTMEIEYGPNGEVAEDAELTMVITMGYNNEPEGDGEWHLFLQRNETRKLNCAIEGEYDERGASYDCEPLSLFELSSVHHMHYLINIRLPIDDPEFPGINENIGLVKDLNIVEIHQNGGFTIIWLTMKSVFFPLVLGMMLFFYRRVGQLGRQPLLMERTILALALVMEFINFPLEWLTLVAEVPAMLLISDIHQRPFHAILSCFWHPYLPLEWLTLVAEVPAMLLISDIRQGAFYAMLFCFWIVFVGEHMMDSVERNSLKAYRQQLVAVVVACICLLLFDLTERGSQLKNPFYSVWNTEQGYKLAMGFIILAAVCVCLYFCFLLFMVFCLFRNLRMKSVAFNSMPKHRKKYYEGLLYRFRFFMVFTMFSAVMTVVFFIMSQINDVNNWYINDEDKPQVHYTSGFFTGVYGLWNVYVLAVLFLYSPSHKDEPLLSRVDPSEGSQVEFEMTEPTPATPMAGPTSATTSMAQSAPSEVYQLLRKTTVD